MGVPRFDNALKEGLELTKWYAQEHVMLCLIPALFIAGGISAFVNQASVMRYLGPKANKALAYGVASVSGTILAVCSCTVLPLFGGIWMRGAGLGPGVAGRDLDVGQANLPAADRRRVRVGHPAGPAGARRSDSLGVDQPVGGRQFVPGQLRFLGRGRVHVFRHADRGADSAGPDRLGMGKGPALALLLAGPALSLPSMLVLRSIMGTKKTVVYVSLVIVMATLTGLHLRSVVHKP